MQRLDWYILKKFLVTFFFCLLLFTIIAIAVDASEHTDDFVKSQLSFKQILTNYYFGFVPYILGLLFPLFVFIAVIWFTSRMAYRSEIIAILASGTSYNRFLRPYFVGGLLLAGLLWWSNRTIIPQGNEIRGNFAARYVDKNDPTKNRGDFNRIFYKRADTNTYVGIRYYDSSQKTANGFFLHRIRDNEVIYNLRAQTMKWDTAARKWQLNNVVERTVGPKGEQLNTYSTYLADLHIQPVDLRRDQYLKDKLTSKQLVQFIAVETLRGTEGLNTYKVERYRRGATAFSVILLTFIGVVIASRKLRGGSGLHLAFGIVVATMFVLSDRFSTTFSVKGNFHPFIAAWLPNFVFTIVAYWLYKKAPK